MTTQRKITIEMELKPLLSFLSHRDLWDSLQNQPLHILLDQNPFNPSGTSSKKETENIDCRELMKSAYEIGRKLGQGNVGRVFEISFKKTKAENRLKEYATLSHRRRGPAET